MTDELDRAIERIMGVSIEAMGGDNLAVLLCSHFDDPDDGSDTDDTGWSETAANAYEEIKREIEGLFVPVRAELAAKDAEIARLKGRLELTGDFADGPDGIECRDETIRIQDARIARLEHTIHQLGENAAKAAGEYAERVAVLRGALIGVSRWLANWRQIDLAEVCADGGVTSGMVVQQEAATQMARISAALTEPTDG